MTSRFYSLRASDALLPYNNDMSANDILYDLSPRIGPELPVWPGDTPFATRSVLRLGDDSPVNLSSLVTTPHLGAHADAPIHTEPRGSGIDGVDLQAYVGPCRVLELVPRDGLLWPDDLPDVDLAEAPRLLLKTSSIRDRSSFPQDFAAVSPALAHHLATGGIRLLGIDTPSVDPFSSKSMEAHHALLGQNVAILEGLLLEPVPPGLYELIALPLPLVGLDASPVRAVLRGLGDEARISSIRTSGTKA